MFDPHCTMVDLEPCMHTAVRVDVLASLPLFSYSCACVCVCVYLCVCLCVCTCHSCLDCCGSRCSPLQDRGDCNGQRWCRHFRWPYDSGSHATGEPAPTSRPSSDWSWPFKGNGWRGHGNLLLSSMQRIIPILSPFHILIIFVLLPAGVGGGGGEGSMGHAVDFILLWHHLSIHILAGPREKGSNGVQRDLEKIAVKDCSAEFHDFTSLRFRFRVVRRRACTPMLRWSVQRKAEVSRILLQFTWTKLDEWSRSYRRLKTRR